MKEGSQRIETYTMHCDPWVKTKTIGFLRIDQVKEMHGVKYYLPGSYRSWQV